jgi:hypothetical protein
MNRYPDPQRSKVVLVGTSDYEYEKKLSRLPAIRNNLFGLEQAFTNPSTGVFDSENCTVADSPDSPKSMIQRIRRAARETEDVLVTYYAGHGLLGWGSKLYLSVRETDPDQLDGTAVPFEWVRDSIRESPADIRILILDCCFSGRAIGAMSSDSAALEQIKISGTTILTSTTANDISHSIPGERYTAFTAELIKLLATPTDGVLTLGSLYRPLSVAMARRGLPSPKNSIGDSSGDIILRRPIAPQYRSEIFSSGNSDSKSIQKPNTPASFAPPAPQRKNYGYTGATVSPATVQQHASFRAPQSEGENTEPLNPSTSGLNLYRRSLSFIPKLPPPMRRPARYFGIFLLVLSAILSGGVLGVGIAQAVRGTYTDGVAALVFALAFVSAWFAGSIFPLILMLKRAFNRRREGTAINSSVPFSHRRGAFTQDGPPQSPSSHGQPHQ